jgi:hypothetical protein
MYSPSHWGDPCPAWRLQGDYVEVYIMTKDGVRVEELQLKLD